MPRSSFQEPTAPAGPAGAWYGVPWAAALAAVVAALVLRPATAQAVGFWTLAASVGLFGLPHGAADWWIMGQAAGERWTRRGQATAAGLYTLAALGTLLFWWWQPGWALAGFLALTAWHFGSADASVLLPARRTFRDPVWFLFALGRGALVVFTPLAFRPAEATRVLLPFADLGGGVVETIGLLPGAAWWLTCGGTAALLLAIRLDARAHPGAAGRRRFTANILETAGLLMLFRVAPPLLSFVAYWVGCHAWRHALRLEWEPPTGHGPRPLARTLWDFHRRTLVVTLLALPGVGLILLIWPALANGPHAVVVYLLLLSALTVPHAFVVARWLDLRKSRSLPDL